MTDELRDTRFEKWSRLLQWVFALGLLLTLGSCVTEIDAIGGGHDSTGRAVGVFFFHLLLVVPCLAAVYVFVQVRLEKHFLSKVQIEHMNEAHLADARKTASRIFGPLNRFSNARGSRKKNR